MERITTKTLADAILRDEFDKNGLAGKVWQYFISVSLAPYALRPHHTRGRGYQQSIYGHYAETDRHDRI